MRVLSRTPGRGRRWWGVIFAAVVMLSAVLPAGASAAGGVGVAGTDVHPLAVAEQGSKIAVARNADGRLELFGVNGSRRVFHRSQTSPNSSTWSGWTDFNGVYHSIAAEANADGRLEVFGVNADGQVFHKRQASPNSGFWSNWEVLDGIPMSAVAAARNADGRLEIFGTTPLGQVFHRWQASPNSGIWSSWTQLDGILHPVAAEAHADGRLELIGVNAAGQVFHRSQTSPNGGAWSGWAQFAVRVPMKLIVAAARHGSGQMEVFSAATTSPGITVHLWQTIPSSDAWSNWTSLDRPAVSQVATETNADGRVEVFVTSGPGQIISRRHLGTFANSGFTPWQTFDLLPAV